MRLQWRRAVVSDRAARRPYKSFAPCGTPWSWREPRRVWRGGWRQTPGISSCRPWRCLWLLERTLSGFLDWCSWETRDPWAWARPESESWFEFESWAIMWPHDLCLICEGNSSVTGEFPSQRPVTRSFDVFFDLLLNKRLSKQSKPMWFETPSRSLWRHCNAFWDQLQFASGNVVATNSKC